MSFLDQSKWRKWAEEWRFVHAPQKPWTYPNEWMAGRYRNRLVRLGWGGDRGRRLIVMIRYPSGVDPDVLWKRMRDDERLAAIPGWKKLKPRIVPPAIGNVHGTPAKIAAPAAPPAWPGVFGPTGIELSGHMLLWSRDFTFRRPKPAQVRQWVEGLIDALERLTPAFDDRCESCGARVDGFVMLDGIPTLMCAGCREQRRMEGQLEEQRYDQQDANYAMGFAFGAAAAVVGGGAWALIAALTGRIFVAAALGIGVLVAWCWLLGARKIDRIGQIAGAGLTMASVAFGDLLFYAYQVSQARPDIGFRLDVGLWVLLKMLQESPAEVLFSLLFGAVGALWAVQRLKKPKFVPQIETPEEAAAAKKKAA